jgi:predicted nucleic acid-binding protein
MIGAYDLIVAATAMERGSEVVTFNRRHFAACRD